MTTKKSPKDMVRTQWQNKAAAADAIIGLIGDPDGRTKARIKRASNQQILDLFAAGQQLQAKFGSREALVAAIAAIKFPEGNSGDAYRQKLSGFGVKRLLDMHKQLSA
jgi:hypothetical protein